jgi:cobalt/nickel transport system ATP-binding protein
MNVIELTGVTFAYGPGEPPVIKNLDLSIPQGSCLAVEGENGSGKTTLFRILNGLSFPQKGRYRFNGTEITASYLKNNQQAKRFHKQMGYLFQNPDIMLFNANVYDEVAFGPRQMGLTDEAVARRTKDSLALFRIDGLADKAPYHLSGGQKKRVALAAVMALNPEVLILDEPYAGLDRKTQDWLTAFLQDLKTAGKTIIIATHQPEAAASLADEVLVMASD